MKEGKSQVEINGRVYDAKSGRLMSLKHSKNTVSTKKVIDGVMKPASSPHNSPKLDLTKSRVTTVQQSQSVHQRSQKTQRLHPAIRETAKAAMDKANTIKRFSSKSTNFKRSQRASNQPKSKLINRHDLKPTEQSVAPPAVTNDNSIAPPLPVMFSKRPKVVDNIAPPQSTQEPQPQEVEDNQSWVRRHLIPAAASFASLALISGFLIYNSLPTLTMRVAAARAGFNASAPNYQPSGFSFEGPVSYGPGRVVIRFDSKTDDRSYIITERESAWDSQSLLDNFVADEAENYLTFEEHGLTVYLYNDSQATWVDNGIWYHISGDANLNSEQLLKIASSL